MCILHRFSGIRTLCDLMLRQPDPGEAEFRNASCRDPHLGKRMLYTGTTGSCTAAREVPTARVKVPTARDICPGFARSWWLARNKKQEARSEEQGADLAIGTCLKATDDLGH